jgi:tRNA modification GTPase
LYSTSDTIVAIATPPGRGGIGVVRVSGPDAESIAHRLITHDGALDRRRATFTRVRRPAEGRCGARETLDHVVVTFFPSPASYTGEDVVELSAHGSPVVLRAIVESAMSIGARLAEPGEFTLRAFLNGRIDLMQAEAVGDLIDAATPLQARAAFDQLEGTLTRAIAAIDADLFDLIARLEASVDFPDEAYHFVEPGALAAEIDRLRGRTAALLADASRGRVVREGLQIAIVGGPNVGKSSLFNALVGTSRAIVADVPGTTRDLVTEVIDLEGLQVTLVDTAGLRETTDFVEAEGVARSRQVIGVADLVLVVVDDVSCETIDNKHVIVQNKIDLGRSGPGIRVSATTGAGLDELRSAMLAALDVDMHRDRPAITNVRHISLVKRAHDAMGRARDAALTAAGSMSEEFVLADLQEARAGLEEITGRRAPGELLEHIFSRFCIGK